MNAAGDEPLPALSRRFTLLLAVVCEGGVLVVALAAAWLVGIPLATGFPPRVVDVALGLGGAVSLLLALEAALRAGAPGAGRLRRDLRLVVGSMFAHSTVFDLLVVSVLAGAGEEALFRGVVQSYLTRRSGPWWGLVGAAALFGLAHAMSRAYVAYATLMGVGFGALFVATGSLVAPAVAHAAYDFMALVYLVRHRPAWLDWDKEPRSG